MQAWLINTLWYQCYHITRRSNSVACRLQN